MIRSPQLAAVLLAGAVLGACGGGGDAATPASAAPSAPSAPSDTTARHTVAPVARQKKQPTGSTLTTHSSAYGRILTDGRGRALYLFTRDGKHGPSTCAGDCARAWPPFLTRGTPRAKGVKAAGLSTIRRKNGTRQVTYRAKPLYFYVGDHAPGEVRCQNVYEFGGTWLVVSPRGRAIR